MKSILALVLALVMMMSLFAGCVQEDPKGSENAPQDDENKVTVTWYYGSKELKKEEVEKGSTLTEWTPTEEGKTFMGWFSEASTTVAFDFTTVINEDTDIFAAFKSEEHVEDTNTYYLIGTGAGDMKNSSWDHNNSAANLALVKDTSITNANVYTIELTMYAGDSFQICFGGSWDGQMGIGHVVGAEYADGVNKYDGNEYTAADKKYAVLKNEAGEVVFEGHDEYNNAYESWNTILAEGQDGKYKITLTTYPNSTAYNTIEVELIEKVAPLTNTHDMQIIGTNNGWGTDGTGIQMTKSDDGSYWLGYITVTPDMWADWLPADAAAGVKVFNLISGEYFDNNGGDNIYLGEGTYAIKYTVEGNVVEVQKLDYYLVGTMVDENGNAVNFSIKEGVTPVLTVVDGVATIEYTGISVTEMPDYSWIATQGKPGDMAVKVVYGCALGIDKWYGDAATGDNFYLGVGLTYVISLDIASGVVTVEMK